jgi:hypothetical protein
MGARENLQRLADKKCQEIEELEQEIAMAKVYLQAIQDSMKVLPREANVGSGMEENSELRAGTLLAKAKDAIVKNGKPMHISEILKEIGVENTKSARTSMVGSLGTYVRKGTVFTRPGPNIFGLVGMNSVGMAATAPTLPENFGEITEGD